MWRDTLAEMEIKLSCSCGQRVLVDSSAGGQQFNCPACSAIMVVPTTEESPVTPLLTPEPAHAQFPNATSIELMCVGNAGNGYINAQIFVAWFEVQIEEEKKHVEVIQHQIPIKNYRREGRVNFCEFDIPNDAVCFVRRHIQTRPNIEENRFFRIQDGQFSALADGFPFDYGRLFLSDYQGYSVRIS